MKVKELLVLGFLVCFAAVGGAYNFNQYAPGSVAMYNVTMTTAESIYTLTISDGPAVQYDLIARGGDIKWLESNTTEATYKTIKQDISDYTTTHVSIPAGTVWYFLSPTNNVTLEAQVWHY